VLNDLEENVQRIVSSGAQKTVTLNIAAGTIKYSSKIKSHRTLEEITGDEEITRAFLVHRLVEQLDYKPESIEIEKPYLSGRSTGSPKRIDVILRDASGNAFFFIEAKAPANMKRTRKRSKHSFSILLGKKTKSNILFTTQLNKRLMAALKIAQ
jgi:type I restriction enzyme M protein